VKSQVVGIIGKVGMGGKWDEWGKLEMGWVGSWKVGNDGIIGRRNGGKSVVRIVAS